MPVFDALTADLEPYPHGLFFQRGYRGTDAIRRGPALTPAEYFELYAALPDWIAVKRDPEAAAAALRAWESAHADIAGKYPAPEILRHVRMFMTRP